MKKKNRILNKKEQAIGRILIELIIGWKTRRSPVWESNNTNIFYEAVDKLSKLCK